jgi:transposase, IS5 family
MQSGRQGGAGGKSVKEQTTFASLAWAGKKKQTKREKFLSEMDRVVPWEELLALIEPHYPKAGNGRRPMPLERMVRLYFLQQWYGLSDPGMEEALYDIESVRRFAGIELGEEDIPDETTILHFRHLLEKHGLTEKLLAEVNQYLSEKKLLLKEGTIVDATLIAAPSSTKNKEKKRDGEMSSTKKGNNYHFGMKVHTGTDCQSGLVHTVKVTTASVHDKQEMDELLHGEEKAVFGDKGYFSDQDKRTARKTGLFWGVLDKAKSKKRLSHKQKRRNRKLSSLRAKVEHPFRVVKRQFGYVKVRYRGLTKNAAQVFTLFALANLYRVRRALLG